MFRSTVKQRTIILRENGGGGGGKRKKKKKKKKKKKFLNLYLKKKKKKKSHTGSEQCTAILRKVDMGIYMMGFYNCVKYHKI